MVKTPSKTAKQNKYKKDKKMLVEHKKEIIFAEV